MFYSERRKKPKSTKNADNKLRPNYFVAIQITNEDVSNLELFVPVCK